MQKQACQLFIVSLMIFSFTAFADQVYTWKDENGVVHYGDKPQYEDSKKIKVDSNIPVDPHAVKRLKYQQKVVDNDDEASVKKAKDEAAAKNKSKETLAKCQKAKKMYASYSNAQYLYKKGNDGKKEILGTDAKQKAMTDLQTYINKYCQ